MAKLEPRRIRGAWADGYALDLHSTGSTFLGHNELGHPEFETHRTEMGELLYRLKYKREETALAEIAETVETFIRSWRSDISVIVPVPPSASRAVQPVFRVAAEIGARLSVPVVRNAVKKMKQIPELKNVYDFDQRRQLLEGAFTATRTAVEGQRVLLVDDLYRSGATLNAVTEALTRSGASVVYALALTQTRRKI
jgi:competence protein ComFC